jgi:cytochrome c5
MMLAAAAAALAAACASAPRRPVAAVAAVPGSDLPAGQGRTILQTSCTVCHDLREVTKFSGYYNKQQWKDIVATMMEYGANIKNDEADVLVEYLTQSIGRK